MCVKLKITLGERLGELLEENCLNYAQLAKIVGVSGQAVSNWHTGNASVKLNHLIKLAEHFNCSVDFLCGRTEDDKEFNKNVKIDFAGRLK